MRQVRDQGDPPQLLRRGSFKDQDRDVPPLLLRRASLLGDLGDNKRCHIDKANLDFFFAAHSIVPQDSPVANELEQFRMLVTNGSDPMGVETSKQRLVDALKSHSLLGKVSRRLGPQEVARRAPQYNEMQQVLPNLWIGPYFPADDKELLKRNGITHVCCCIPVDPRFPKDFSYLMLNADDSPSQNIRQFFDRSHRFISAALRQGGGVLVHCGAGISRCSTITIAFLMKAMGIRLDDAYALVKKARPFVRPNNNFLQQLMQFEGRLLGANAKHYANGTKKRTKPSNEAPDQLSARKEGEVGLSNGPTRENSGVTGGGSNKEDTGATRINRKGPSLTRAMSWRT